MRYLPLLLILVTSLCFAEVNEKYSYKAFSYHGLSFKDRPASEFNNTTIIGSCFYQQWEEGDKDIVKDIFPDGITGVIFEKCNLDNIYIPLGNTIKDSCHRKIKIQNDLCNWILNEDLTPKEPMDKERRIRAGISIDSKDLPDEKITQEQWRETEATINSVNH